MSQATKTIIWTPKTLAERTGVSVPTLHFYEEKGLISASRTRGNQRRYDNHMARRIAFIQAGQKAGIQLADIKKTLDKLPHHRTPTAHDWEKIASEWHIIINERISRLERMRDQLSSCINCGCLSMKKCHLYNPDDSVGAKNSQSGKVSEL